MGRRDSAWASAWRDGGASDDGADIPGRDGDIIRLYRRRSGRRAGGEELFEWEVGWFRDKGVPKQQNSVIHVKILIATYLMFTALMSTAGAPQYVEGQTAVTRVPPTSESSSLWVK